MDTGSTPHPNPLPGRGGEGEDISSRVAQDIVARAIAGPPVDTSNHFVVGARGDHIVILNPPLRAMSKDEAINLLCWMRALIQDDTECERVYQAILNT